MSAVTTNTAVSFWQLIAEHKIEIPIIQRDYAQGRDDDKTKKIRNGFLKNIIDSLQSESSSLELDFVYGKVINDVLQPLDGQQRLTTLFLLHWFVALKTNKLSENKSAFLKFTYETRISSREFCNELVKNWNDLGEGELLTDKISDSKWFVSSWKKDPTIKAMLTMLDAIEEKLKNIDAEELLFFWKQLTSETPPITFNFKKLNDIGLTDDLYIKMNARGKSLTEFENFKARFEKYIKESNCDKIDWEADYKDKPRETFAHKIDTIWTDLFWKHRGNDNLIDNEFIKFIAGIAITTYAQNLEIISNAEDEERTRKSLEEKSKAITADAIKRDRIERKIQLLFNSPEEVNPDDFPTKKAFDYLISCLDYYSNGTNDEILPNDLPLWDYCKNGKVEINNISKINNNLFVELIKNSETSYKQRVLFFAQTQYLLDSRGFNQEFFSHWMRVIRNIVQNITIDSAAGFIGAIGLINELSIGSSNIYEYLAKNEIKSGVASIQTKEEKLKAGLILNNWKSQIFKIEDDSFLKGEIKFLLDYSKTSDVCVYEKFKTLTDIFLLLFESKDDLLRRALLTQDDYPMWDGYTSSLETHRYSLLHSDNEWKNAFRKSSGEFNNAVLKLISHNHIITEERSNILNNIIQNAEPLDDYRHHLVNNIKLLNNCYHKRFCVSDKALYVLEKTKVVGDNYKKIKL